MRSAEQLRQKREWYYANREKILADAAIRVSCKTCNCTVSKGKLSHHLNTPKHIENVHGRKVVTEKCCPKCKQLKQIDCYAISNDRRSGRSSWCKQCIRRRAKMYGLLERERGKEIRISVVASGCGIYDY
jgi:hypothetical protein